MLHRKRLVLWCAEPDHLALGVESIEVDVGDDAQRARRVGRGELRELTVRELGTAPSGLIQRRRGPWERGSGHAFSGGEQFRACERTSVMTGDGWISEACMQFVALLARVSRASLFCDVPAA